MGSHRNEVNNSLVELYEVIILKTLCFSLVGVSLKIYLRAFIL